jgi:hypothetical protein
MYETPVSTNQLETKPSLKIDEILQVHRHTDGYIQFAVMSDDGRWESLASLRPDELDSLLPMFRNRLEKDSFFSINASYSQTRSLTSQRPRKYHSAETLSHLCACYADIDCYRAGLTVDDAVGRLIDADKAGRIPAPSIVVESGRGVWVLWLLQDRNNPDQAHKGAWLDNPLDHQLLYRKIQRSIHAALVDIGCDPLGTDAARHIRMDGSLNTKSEELVRWWMWGRGNSAVSYTLKDLATFFQIPTEKPVPVLIDVTGGEDKRYPKRARGHKAAGQTKVKVIELLFTTRNGFTKGHRNRALFLYAMALRGAHVSEQGARLKVLALSTECRPTIRPGEANDVVHSAFNQKKSRLSYQTIADDLTVTAEEAKELSTLTKKPFPAASHFPQSAFASKTMGRQATRRAAIQEIIQGGLVPSYREMQELLAAESIECSYVTVKSDYAALEIESNGQRNRKAIADQKNRQLKLVVP